MIDFSLPPFFSPVTHQGEFGSLHCFLLLFALIFSWEDIVVSQLLYRTILYWNYVKMISRSDSFQVKFELILTEQKEIGEHFQIIFSYHEKCAVLSGVLYICTVNTGILKLWF